MHEYSTSPAGWQDFQIELRELAFSLDRQGNPTAADVATMAAVRIGELLAESGETARE
ncbi:hypothetical protein [Actomonas aquatica]|uniref:Uncharacterized protein n=1 Tax=Actomonas aquatica TaxID=2866162 RepID=A0ABZ1C2K7_9BACT|nr:hypothetical protein [Opitutus sp. WL0086]WRQ85946.1 hypothetical protein K1X11_014125 [Opitutus sp. WL0086]